MSSRRLLNSCEVELSYTRPRCCFRIICWQLSFGGWPMLLRSIRSRLLGLVLATVVPFTALIGGGFWSQWRNDRAAAIDRALAEARLLAAQVDDHIGNL